MVKSKLFRILVALVWLAVPLVGQPVVSLHAAALVYARAAVRAPAAVPTPPPPAQPTVAGDALWDSRFMLGADNAIFATVFAPNGDLYVGGSFTRIAGLNANRVARWSAATNQWSALGSGVGGGLVRVSALAVSGNVLYVGGDFTQAGGAVASAVAAWNINTQTWSNLGGGMALAGSIPSVRALAADGSGNVYAGGEFDSAGGVGSQNIARWNGSAWSGLGGGVGTTGNEVDALAVTGSDVFAGGGFTTPGVNLAHFNGSVWTGVGAVNGPVAALALSGSDLYVAGTFLTVSDDNGSHSAHYIAQWHIQGNTWSPLDTGLNDQGDAIAVGPGGVYVTGFFSGAGSSTTHFVAVWNGSTWSYLKNPSLAAVDGLNGIGLALAISGNDVIVGGLFNHAGGHPASRIARWNTADQQWYSPGNTVNGAVKAVALSGNDVFVGGDFTSAGGLSANSVAQWNSVTNAWSALSYGLAGCTGFLCLGPTVKALAVNGNFVYVGGNFTSAGGLTANNIARWDRVGHTWNNLGLGVIGCTGLFCSAEVAALAPDGAGVDVGGTFITITAGAVTANNLARWTGGAWLPFVDTGHIVTGTNGPVYAIAPAGLGDAYIGGAFTFPFPYYVLFNGDWVSGQTAPNGPVRALLLSAHGVFIGGDFTNAAGSGADHIAQASGHGDWQPLGSSLNNSVNSLALRGNTLFAGGVFTQSGALGLDNIAAWDVAGNQWSNLGSGTDNAILALAADSNFVYAGGGFTNAGGKESDSLARWGQYQLFLPTVRR